MAFTQITIVLGAEQPDGSKANGRVTASLSEAIANAGEVIEPGILAAYVNDGRLVTEDGQPFTLAANDDSGTSPTGSYYHFTVELDNMPFRSFTAAVPASSPSGQFDLSTYLA